MEMSLSEEKKQRFWELLASHPKNEQQKTRWGPGQGGGEKGQSSATFLEFRAWPLRGSCDHTYVTLLLASQRDGRMARRALNSAGLL